LSENILTTAEVGKIIGVNQSTVFRWVSSGKLKAHTTGGGHNRIARKDLIEFFRKNSKRLPENLQDQQTEKLKILIVDDELPVLDVLAAGLKVDEDKYKVETATDGFEAGQVLEKFQPDIVVLDIFLPTIDGYKVCQTIKKNYPNIKVIAITGKGSEEVKKNIIAAGADTYLEKPFEIGYLSKTIGELLRTIAITKRIDEKG